MYRIDQAHCIECELCGSICPKNAVKKADIAYQIGEQCVKCGLCAKKCPVGAIQSKE